MTANGHIFSDRAGEGLALFLCVRRGRRRLGAVDLDRTALRYVPGVRLNVTCRVTAKMSTITFYITL